MYSHCEYCNRKDYENCAHVLLISIEWVRINIWNGNLDTDKLQNILIDQVTVNNLLQMINCYKVILFSDGPSISVDKLYMTHHRQLTLELVCSAQSNPPASLQWSRMDDTTGLWSPVGPNIGDNTRDMDGVWTENRQVSQVQWWVTGYWEKVGITNNKHSCMISTQDINCSHILHNISSIISENPKICLHMISQIDRKIVSSSSICI